MQAHQQEKKIDYTHPRHSAQWPYAPLAVPSAIGPARWPPWSLHTLHGLPWSRSPVGRLDPCPPSQAGLPPPLTAHGLSIRGGRSAGGGRNDVTRLTEPKLL
ncbi:hypothetical protein AAFF_G00045490 [Aldrovandia affinis]|uniref:Uncharacterized protein n=1 Tax=Aldrovandia affinis TaxID=143900 RepID=A0AAD7S217_9TELE|nr:hypothetical protein AAFF_G00045490 [Aldrovandia affinis]